ncbi:uncharacterized protein [Ptychodera flava]|uniref:uncharacterized protein n=1 Tax=Ptychodera flava TaxID=63121 RepID=UPI00396A03F2
MDFAHGNIPGAAADNNTGTMSSGYHTAPSHAVPCEDDVHSNGARPFDIVEWMSMPQSDQMAEMPAGADGWQPHLQPVCSPQWQFQQRQHPGENQLERPRDDRYHGVNPGQSQSLLCDKKLSLLPYLLEQRRQCDFYKANNDSAAYRQSHSQYRMPNAPHQPHHADRSQGDKQSHHHPHPGQARQHHQQFHVLNRVMTDSEKSPLDPSLRSSSTDIEMLPLGHCSSEIQEVLPQGLNFCQPGHQFVCLQQRRFYQQQQDREYRRDGAKEDKPESQGPTPAAGQSQYLLEQCRQHDFCNAHSDSSLHGQAETLYNRTFNSQCTGSMPNAPHQPHHADRSQGDIQHHHHPQPGQAIQHHHQQFHMLDKATCMTDSERSPSDSSLGFSSTDIEMGPLRHSSGDRQEELPQDFPQQRLQDERHEMQTFFHDTQNPDLKEFFVNPSLTDSQDNESFFLENNSIPRESYNPQCSTLHPPQYCQVIITSNTGSSTDNLSLHGIQSHPAISDETPKMSDNVDQYGETMRVGQWSAIAEEQSHGQQTPITEPSIKEYHTGRSSGLESSSVTSDKSSYNNSSRCQSSDDDAESLRDIERPPHHEATRPLMDEHQGVKVVQTGQDAHRSTSRKKMPQQSARQTCYLGNNSLNIQGLSSVESHQQGHKQHPWQKVGDMFKKILPRKRSKCEAYSKVKQNKGKRKVDAASTASSSVSEMARKCPSIEVVVACDRDSSVPFPVVERRVSSSIPEFGSRPRSRTILYQKNSSEPVRIFITYALSQKEYARQLADILRRNNFEVNLDLTKDCYKEKEFNKFTKDNYGWRSSIYNSSSYIIVLCSRDYCQEAQCKEYELEATCLSTSWFYCQMETDFHLRRGRFIPVLSPGCDTSCVPSFLKTCILDWPCDMDKEDRLLRRLTNRSTAPKLGAPLPIVEITFNIRRVKDSDISCTSANDDARSFLI